MKLPAIFIVLALLWSPLSEAKRKPKAPTFDHSAKIVFHSISAYDQIKDRHDLFYDGDYICMPGSEHYAPDCHTISDWGLMRVDERSIVTLDDGRAFVIGRYLCTSVQTLKACSDSIAEDLRNLVQQTRPKIHMDGDAELVFYRITSDGRIESLSYNRPIR